MQILKTVVDHGAMPVVEFHGEGGEEIQVRLKARSMAEDDEALIEVAKVMMLHAAAFNRPIKDNGEPGTVMRKPGWERLAQNRPGGYLPAVEDPDRDRDAMGEILADPDKGAYPMRLPQETVQKSDKMTTRIERAIEADYYARRVGITKKEAYGMLRDGDARVAPAEKPTADPLVMFLAEHTDLSPNQAKDLVDQEGRNLHKLRKIARTMKAES